MSAIAAAALGDRGLFGDSGLKITPKILSAIVDMCSPDKPMANTSLFSDFAITEICISNAETMELKNAVGALRTDDQKRFVSDIIDALQSKAKSTRNSLMEDMCDAIEMEYKRLCKVFFLRARCYEVIRNSTNTVLGRLVMFPDQISDDFGFNLDEHNESNMNQIKVSRSQKWASHASSTVYVGQGVGSVMAQLCGFLKDAPVIVFDGTVLSDMLVRNAFRMKLPKPLKLSKRSEEARDCNILFFHLDTGINRWEPMTPKVLDFEAAAVEAQEARILQQEVAAAKKKNTFLNSKEKQQEKKDFEEQKEQAQKYFKKITMFQVLGVVSPVMAAKAAGRTGRFSAAMLSDLFADYMTSIKEAPYFYELPKSKDDCTPLGDEEEQKH